jgi:hypothetical protein
VSQLQTVSLFVAIRSRLVAVGWVWLQLVHVELQLVRRVAIGSAAKLQPQGLCIYYTECTWVHFIYIYRSSTHQSFSSIEQIEWYVRSFLLLLFFLFTI